VDNLSTVPYALIVEDDALIVMSVVDIIEEADFDLAKPPLATTQKQWSTSTVDRLRCYSPTSRCLEAQTALSLLDMLPLNFPK